MGDTTNIEELQMAELTEENLNIEYHTLRLIIIALNRHKFIVKAAEALGCGLRKIKDYRAKFSINKIDDVWQIDLKLPITKT